MVVSGVPRRNGVQHAGEVARMALELVETCRAFVIPHRQGESLVIRVGIHSGEWAFGWEWAGVAGGWGLFGWGLWTSQQVRWGGGWCLGE